MRQCRSEMKKCCERSSERKSCARWTSRSFTQGLRKCVRQTGDRAVLRAIHFFNENRRVQMQVRALKNDNFACVLALRQRVRPRVIGRCLQNVIAARRDVPHQEMALTLALCQAAARTARAPCACTAAASRVQPSRSCRSGKIRAVQRQMLHAALGDDCCPRTPIITG